MRVSCFHSHSEHGLNQLNRISKFALFIEDCDLSLTFTPFQAEHEPQDYVAQLGDLLLRWFVGLFVKLVHYQTRVLKFFGSK